MAEPKIEIDHLSRSFERNGDSTLNVLDDISLSIAEGEFVSVIGPSGCGKTTLMKIIAGILPPSNGSVRVDGTEVKEPGRDRGVIFQEDVIFLWRTVIENVEYGMEIRGIDRETRRQTAMQYLKMVGLEEFRDFYPKELSGGMRTRVAVAMVFANDPKVLLMDEPFGALDYPTKVDLQQELLEIWSQEQKTTVFITHDLEEALFLSDRIVVLRDTKIKEIQPAPWKRPRGNELRNQDDFQEIKAKLWKYIE